MKKVCGNCLYRVYGQCYYNPPAVVFADYHAVAVHPPVKEDDRCSKFEVHPRILSNPTVAERSSAADS